MIIFAEKESQLHGIDKLKLQKSLIINGRSTENGTQSKSKPKKDIKKLKSILKQNLLLNIILDTPNTATILLLNMRLNIRDGNSWKLKTVW